MCPLPAAGGRPRRQGLQAAWQPLGLHPACGAWSSAGHHFGRFFSSPSIIILVQMIITQRSNEAAVSCSPIELVCELRDRIPLSSVLGEGGRFAQTLHQPFPPFGELGGVRSTCSPRTGVQGEGGQRALASAHRAGPQHRWDETMLEWADGGCPRVGVSLPPCRTSFPLRQWVLLAVSCSPSTDPVLHGHRGLATSGFLYIHAAAGAGSVGWVELGMLLSPGCCLLDNYFPLSCTPLQVPEGVCAEQVCLRAVNSCSNSS